MLKSQFVPVAIDQAYQRRQKDTEGDFYRKIARQGPRSNFNATTQGFYIAKSTGELLLYNNNRDPEKVERLMRKALKEFAEDHESKLNAKPISTKVVDDRFNLVPPEGAVILRVHGKVLGGYEKTEDRWRIIFQNAISRDNMWITQDEQKAIVQGKFPKKVAMRLARYHLMDGTRGEPLMWLENQVQDIELNLVDGRISGHAHIESDDGQRGYHCDLVGTLDTDGDRITDFKIVALGDCWGDGPYTRGAPKGKFPLAISFTLADGTDIADGIPPQGCKGWNGQYLR